MSETAKIECAFTGRVITEPTQRQTKSGKPWLSFTCIIGDGDTAQFVQVSLFGDAVEKAGVRLAKDVGVYVEGAIKLNSWTTSDGTQRTGLSVSSFKCDALGLIGRKRPPSQHRSDGTATPERQKAAPESAKRDFARPRETDERGTHHMSAADSEIPF